MRVSEIFHSIQGEGKLAGVPSVFIRTSGCNLRCTWCDTPYTSWDAKGRQMTVDQIAERVAGYDCKHVILTGGEPMIAGGVEELSHRIRRSGHHLTIETAATIGLVTMFAAIPLAVVALKLSTLAEGTAAAT